MNIGNSLALLVILLLTGCSRLPEKRSIVRNPTRYTFNSSMDTLREVIISEFAGLKYRDMRLYYEGSTFLPPDASQIFTQHLNSNDFFLAPTYIWIGDSFLYPNLKYIASFHFHLIEINASKTEVVVRTIKPRVILGKEFFPNFPHFARGYRYRDVEPSTIEEYEILHRIGVALNQEMPNVTYPLN